ncbi:PPE family protein [Mycobacterium paragordonae]|uniref:PPE family protein n=1 Tax=Mycobacterium paragordonae TaxID=1389713 RepID=A0A4R5WUR5_9MYCO|nr:PPE family protein [Mycobacterium paragordonae]MDP7734920.1 PPE family protein [Mycobacterium paragordonae]TDK95632.1 PPE family protein [Mycobacterium paragordonae]TDK96596.1 PPE family protein [Mycobacterium paragordonae]
MDFGALPPEINSLRMYTGPGSAPLLAAMTAWNEVADEMRLAATAYESVLSGLVSEGWLGPASAAMTAAVVPYVTWMSATGLQAEQTAGQAAAAAAAYEAAFAMTVPPAVVAANRAQLLMLVATNFLGINTPAIAATEAEYAEMWAQDATAMYVYAANAAEAATLTPFREPDQTTNPGGPAAQAAAVSQASGSAVTQTELPQLMSTVPGSLQQLASPAAASPFDNIPQTGLLADILNFLDGNDGNPYGIFLNSNLVNGIVAAQFISPTIIFPATTDALADVEAVADGAAEAAPAAADASSATAGLTASQSGGVGAGVNQASFVGRLSVPPSWTTAVEVANRAVPASGAAVTAAPEAGAGMPGMPGMPAPAAYSRNWGNGPRYGFKLTIMPRPVAAG